MISHSPQRFVHHEDADAVVHRLANVELLGLRRFLLLVTRQVRWLARRLERAAERLAVGGRYEDSLGDHVGGIMAAQGLQADEALVVYVLDEEADLVRVRGDNHAPVAASLLSPDHSA